MGIRNANVYEKNELNDDVLDELQDNYECYNDELEKRLYYSIGHIERDNNIPPTKVGGFTVT